MKLGITADVSARAPALRAGWLTMRGLQVRQKDEALWQAVEAACADFATRCGLNAIAADPRIAAVRRLFRVVGTDPTRYRPSSEALVRRVAQGKGLYQVNSAVDVNNWGSLEARLPFGIYDAARLTGDVLLRIGRDDEAYEGIGKSLISLEGKLLLADERGPFGSPISDSTRAMVGEQTRDIHLVVFAPDLSREALTAILQTAAGRMARYNGGAIEQVEVV